MADVTPSFTVRPILRPDKANAGGLCPVSICITMNGRRAYHSTGLRIKPEQWKDGRVRAHPNASLYNARIAKAINEAEAELLKTEARDIRTAKNAVTGDKGKGSFIDYAAQVLPTLKNSKGKPIAYNTKRRWEYDLEHVRRYTPGLRFGEITPDWLKAFNKHLCTWMDQNSARKTFVFIRRIFNEALEDKVTTLYPFRDWKLPNEVEKPVAYLVMQEVDKIRALLDDDTLPDSLRNTAAHFLLECYSGIRFSDWGNWQTERLTTNDNFYLTTTKNKEPIYLPLKDSPRLKEIIEIIRLNRWQYDFTNYTANKHLKDIRLLSRIKKHITTHMGRHTAATMLLEKGFSKETVAEVLGVTMRVIDKYAKITRQKIRGEFERIGGL